MADHQPPPEPSITAHTITGMGLLGDIRSALAPAPPIRSPWSPSPSHLETIVWSDIFGTKHKPLTRAEAMTVPAVVRARRLIAAAIARMPIHVWDEDRDVTPAWLTRTDTGVHPWHRMLWTIDDLIFYGWSLWQLDRDDTDAVLTADRLAPHRWQITADGDILVDDRPVGAHEICAIPGPDEGLLTTGRTAVRHAAKLINAADRAADTPSPTVNLHQTNDYRMSDEERSALISSWASARRGENGGVAFTSNGIEAQEMNSVQEHLLIEGRNASAVDVARVMGIPASMIDATGPKASLSYETTEGKASELVNWGLSPFMSAITARLSLDDMTAPGHVVRFDADRLVGPLADADAEDQEDTPA